MALEESDEICEALLRHTETSGSEVFEKHFMMNGRVAGSIWCIVGPNSEDFSAAVRRWLDENGFKLDR